MSSIRKKSQRNALLLTCLILGTFFAICVGFLYWAAQAPDSEMARSVRKAIGIPEPFVEPAPAPPAPKVVAEAPPEPESEPAPEPEIPPEPEPAPLPEITYAEIASRADLWPEMLRLELSKRVYIRYNGNVYGHMQFSSGMPLKVDALGKSGEVFGWIDGNYLSLSIEETNFEDWFRSEYAERYQLQPIQVEPVLAEGAARHQVGTKQGDAEFWTEMRIWCDRNYDSISLDIQEDTLVFRWLPNEDVPIDYALEAREIARNFLLMRAARGSNENYASCEIRHPVTDELLGASSIFIPRL